MNPLLRIMMANKIYGKATLLALVALCVSPGVWAAGPPLKSSLNDPLILALVILMILLLLVIALLANVLLGTLKLYQEKRSGNGKGVGAAMVTVLLLASLTSFAQTPPAADATAAAVVPVTYGGLSALTFYLIMSVLVVEVVVILFMLVQLKAVLAKEKARVEKETAPAAVKKPALSWWDRFNKFRPAEQEADIDLGHEYDGIRELDNRLPPWWLWGFYITIVAAGIYLWRYHVVHSAPLSAEEFEISMKLAEKEQAEYLKKAANLVDENSVQLLTTDFEINSGKNLYTLNCVACHGKLGEGGVGPNLTDEYWIHGGGIKDIFKTIKYGWQDKGMKSWKEDFTPTQMAQLSSYIYKLKGTNPPNPKAPQGDIYKEEAAPAAADSTAAKTTAVSTAPAN